MRRCDCNLSLNININYKRYDTGDEKTRMNPPETSSDATTSQPNVNNPDL